MTKNLRMDDNGQMYVERVTEVEVQSSDEILGQYMKGGFIYYQSIWNLYYAYFLFLSLRPIFVALAQERRKQAETELNALSSRSHSIFNIRLVMAPGVDREGNIFERIRPENDESKVILSLFFCKCAFIILDYHQPIVNGRFGRFWTSKTHQ